MEIYLRKCIKVITLFITCLSLINCSNGPTTQHYEIDPAFEPHVAEFLHYANQYDADLSKMRHLQIRFVETTKMPNAIGVCSQLYKAYTVTILASYWYNASHYSREQLIFHELGHCILNKEHKNGYAPVDNQMRPLSIMNQYHISDDVYVSFRDELIFDLFSN